MKLSKVKRVLDKFNIDNFGDYQIDRLDLNRVPDPKSGGNKVTLLLEDGSRRQLQPPEITRFEANRDDLEAVEVHHQNSNKMLLIN